MEMLEETLHNLGPETNPKFRLWISTQMFENCSEILLKKCVKVALQQPINIKQKVERHLMTLKEGIFRRGQDFATFHKNLYFGLCYLHAILDGRRTYGPLGWHVVYEFDKNDFEISDSIVTSYMKKEYSLRLDSLQSMKYIFSNINFAGKISRVEDQRKLYAHVEDLFNEEIMFAYEVAMDLNNSHFGFLNKDADFLAYIKADFPKNDDFRIFGFNQNIFRHNQKKIAVQIMSELKKLNKKELHEVGYAEIHNDLSNKINRFGLERANFNEKTESSLIKQFV